MKKIIVLALLLVAYVYAVQQVFVLNFEITKSDEVKIISLDYAQSNVDFFDESQNEYFIKILDKDSNMLFFKPITITFYMVINSQGNLTGFDASIDKVTKRIRLPYFADAKYIQLMHKENVIANIDVSSYLCNRNNNCDQGESPAICPKECSNIICGNKQCEQGENFENCPLDCTINDGLCTLRADGKCDPDCKTGADPDCSNCGNNVCESNENYVNCPKDCKTVCGNNICEQGESEDCQDCKKETNITKPVCGNGICESNEINCPGDCQLKNCGNRVCDADENYAACPKDCLSGSKDGFCDKILDSRCDPDCKDIDLDCQKCNNNRICDENENIAKCPKDCLKKSYIIYFTGGLILIILLILIAKYKKPETIQ